MRAPGAEKPMVRPGHSLTIRIRVPDSMLDQPYSDMDGYEEWINRQASVLAHELLDRNAGRWHPRFQR